MIMELLCIGMYYLALDYLWSSKPRKEITKRSEIPMKGEIMKEIERKIKGMSITAGGNVTININIQVNNYSYENCNKLTFNESPLHLNDFSHSLLLKKEENYFDKALRLSLEETSFKSIRGRELPNVFEWKDPLERYRSPFLKELLESINKK